ncbi:MAG: hypothetical protein RI959_838 [Pseudomonadota bacterium]
MNAPSMHQGHQQRVSSHRTKGVIIVVLVHALIAWALDFGMAREGLNPAKKPLEAVVIQEVRLPPPPSLPSPPPKVTQTPQIKVSAPPPLYVPPRDAPNPEVTPPPTLQAAAAPSPVPAVIAPPPQPAPPAPPAPPSKPAPQRTDIGLACPTQVAPEMPARALREGISGVVRVQAAIVNGAVKDVVLLSGPPVFLAAVRTAMMQYRCVNNGELTALQEFNFKLD